MRPMAVVPGGIQSQLLPEGAEAVGNEYQAAGALGLEGPHAPLYDGETPILPDGPESVLNFPPAAPSQESLRAELNALVRD